MQLIRMQHMSNVSCHGITNNRQQLNNGHLHVLTGNHWAGKIEQSVYRQLYQQGAWSSTAGQWRRVCSQQVHFLSISCLMQCPLAVQCKTLIVACFAEGHCVPAEIINPVHYFNCRHSQMEHHDQLHKPGLARFHPHCNEQIRHLRNPSLQLCFDALAWQKDLSSFYHKMHPAPVHILQEKRVNDFWLAMHLDPQQTAAAVHEVKVFYGTSQLSSRLSCTNQLGARFVNLIIWDQ